MSQNDFTPPEVVEPKEECLAAQDKAKTTKAKKDGEKFFSPLMRQMPNKGTNTPAPKDDISEWVSANVPMDAQYAKSRVEEKLLSGRNPEFFCDALQLSPKEWEAICSLLHEKSSGNGESYAWDKKADAVWAQVADIIGHHDEGSCGKDCCANVEWVDFDVSESTHTFLNTAAQSKVSLPQRHEECAQQKNEVRFSEEHKSPSDEWEPNQQLRVLAKTSDWITSLVWGLMMALFSALLTWMVCQEDRAPVFAVVDEVRLKEELLSAAKAYRVEALEQMTQSFEARVAQSVTHLAAAKNLTVLRASSVVCADGRSVLDLTQEVARRLTAELAKEFAQQKSLTVKEVSP